MYTGIIEVTIDNDQQLADFYEGKYGVNIPELYINQYVIVKSTAGKVYGKYRWTGTELEEIRYHKFDTALFGKFSPRNTQQELAFDLLQNDSITGKLLIGGFGSGKTMMSLVHAIDGISGKRPKYDRLIYLRNNIQTKNTADIGALPADLNSKIKPYAMPLADILGEETQLDYYIETGRIKLEHIGFIRGRTYRNSVVFVSEAENLTKDLMGLIISRVGEGSILIVEGDAKQCDKQVFEKDSGIFAMAEALKGEKEFGMVTLQKNERSPFASLSDKVLEYCK